MGEHDGLDVVEAIGDVVKVGQDEVDAGLVLFREQHSAVDDQQLAVELEDGHVATDLAEPTKCHYTQGSRRQRPGRLQIRVRMCRSAHAPDPSPSGTPAAARSATSRAISSSLAGSSGSLGGPAGKPWSSSAALVRVTAGARNRPTETGSVL